MIHIAPVGGRDNPVGLPVLDRDGRQVGTVSGVDGDALRVDVATDAPAAVLRSAGWNAGDTERPLPGSLVAERTRDAVRLDA